MALTSTFQGPSSSRMDAKDPQVPGARVDRGGAAPRAADQQTSRHLVVQG